MKTTKTTESWQDRKDRNLNETLEEARAELGWDTLETRNSDRLDFHEVSAAQMVRLLEQAFEAGRRSAR